MSLFPVTLRVCINQLTLFWIEEFFSLGGALHCLNSFSFDIFFRNEIFDVVAGGKMEPDLVYGAAK